MPTHRLFFAVWPPTPTRERLLRLADELAREYRARWIRAARYHVTLCFLASAAHFPSTLAASAVRAGTRVRVPAFDWQLDRIRGFRARRPPCVVSSRATNEALQRLHAALCAALRDVAAGAADARAFTPHVTLGYGHGRIIAERAVEPIDFPVREFVLLHSVSGEGSYRELGRWPLAG